MTHDTFTCDALDARLSDYLEGTLDVAARASVERHLASCARCSALVADLRAIARDAAELPELAPSRDLWADIERRIEPAVIPLAAARAGRAPRMRAAWLTAAAAALVAATASVTYVATRHSMSQQSVAAVTRDSASAPVTPGAPVTPRESLATPAAESRRVASSGGSTNARSTVTTVGRTQKLPAEIAYDREIGRLERIVHDRRSGLDSNTVAVIEKNLRVIDAAIADSRAALARDPRSRFLNDQLNDALDRKVELLRTVAFLPSGT